MANRELTLTVSEETARSIEAKVASGRFSDASEVVEYSIESLESDDEWFTEWIRREALPALEELDSDPSSGSTLEQILADINEEERKQLPQAS